MEISPHCESCEKNRSSKMSFQVKPCQNSSSSPSQNERAGLGSPAHLYGLISHWYQPQRKPPPRCQPHGTHVPRQPSSLCQATCSRSLAVVSLCMCADAHRCTAACRPPQSTAFGLSLAPAVAHWDLIANEAQLWMDLDFSPFPRSTGGLSFFLGRGAGCGQ